MEDLTKKLLEDSYPMEYYLCECGAKYKKLSGSIYMTTNSKCPINSGGHVYKEISKKEYETLEK